MGLKLEDCVLYAVTDTSWLRGQTLAQQVEAALRGGATMVQLREKKLEGAMRTMLGIGPKIHLVPPKTITRSEGKAVRVIDKRKLHD